MKSILNDINNRLITQLENAQSISEAFDTVKGDYTVLTDKEGIIRDMSAPYLALLGYTKAALLGKHFKILVHPDYKEEITKIQNRYISGDLTMPGSWLLQKADGTPIRVFVDAVRISDDHDNTFKLSIITPIEIEKS